MLKGVKELSKNCLKIKTIDISFCNNITEKGLKELLENCKNLYEINLFKIDNLMGKIRSLKEIYPNISFNDI